MMVNKQNGPENSGPFYCFIKLSVADSYLYCAINPFASVTIFAILSSFNWPFLNSANTSGNLFSISIKKCDSNSFTFLTATSFNKPCVPRYIIATCF